MLPAQAGVSLMSGPLIETRQMLPAQAGVIPSSQTSLSFLKNAPRAGGGDPKTTGYIVADLRCSPRRRG